MPYPPQVGLRPRSRLKRGVAITPVKRGSGKPAKCVSAESFGQGWLPVSDFDEMDYPGILSSALSGLIGRGTGSELETGDKKGTDGNRFAYRYDGVWLAGGRLPISADPPLARLMKGVETVASSGRTSRMLPRSRRCPRSK